MLFINIATKYLLLLAASIGAYAMADEYSERWGPNVGEVLPVLQAYDQAGRLRTLENLVGERGLLLSLNRSADW